MRICAVSGVFVVVLFCVWCADFITCYFGAFWLRICAVFGKVQCLVWCCFACLYVVYLVFFCILGVYLRCIKYSVFWYGVVLCFCMWFFDAFFVRICAVFGVFGVFGVVCPGLRNTKLSCCYIVSVTASSDSLDEHSQ